MISVDSPLDIIKVEDILKKNSKLSSKEFDRRRGVKKMLKLFNIFILCAVHSLNKNPARYYLEIHLFQFNWGCFIERIRL